MNDEECHVRVTVDARNGEGRVLLAPQGLSTPHETCGGVDVAGAKVKSVEETTTGQTFLVLTPDAERVEISYRYLPGGAAYPDAIFDANPSRYTRAADGLVAEASAIAPELTGADRLCAIAEATAERFVYGHPDAGFNDGLEEIPALGCGLTEGSCVDINAYLIASFRAAGFEAGYVTGYFFPAEKVDHCEDMHCWVLTRHAHEVLEWDVAHHMKMGVRDIRPALNPKPGRRAAVAHSMGLAVPTLGISGMKLLAEPVWVDGRGGIEDADVDIRLIEAPARGPGA